MVCDILEVSALIVLSTDLSADFMRDVQEFAKILYVAGATELESRKVGHADPNTDFNPYQLMVHANGACVELLFWSIREESGEFVFFYFYKIYF